MLHPRLTSLDGQQVWLAQIGPYGAWDDLAYTFRWGEGACGMYEASWNMSLPPDFDHPVLRRGTLVEIMDGLLRIGCPLIMSEPARGTGFNNPWSLTATGIGREVEGENSFYALDGSGNTTSVPSTAIDAAMARPNGLRWDGRDASVSTSAVGSASTTDQLNTIAALLNASADSLTKRWGVGQDNKAYFYSDPTAPSYQVVSGASALGVADDDYASVVLLRYLDSTTGTYLTRTAPAVASATQTRYGRREYPVDRTDLGGISAATAQGFADGILAKSKGRLGWTNGLTVNSNEILTMGDEPAGLSKVAEDVGSGCMIRLHGIYNDLLEYNGQTWLDLIIGEAKYVDGADTIDLNPLGMAKRDLASIVEEVSGPRDVAA